MSLTIKVFFERANGPSEIRRFPVSTAPGIDSFAITKEKIRQLYPALANGTFTMFWQDPDGDRVAFSSREEMNDALAHVKDGVLRIYIPENMEHTGTSAQPTSQDKKEQAKPSDGQQTRDKPQPQGQFCGTGQGQGQQPPTEGDGPVHIGVTCDGCEGPVVGIRYKCCVCPDYDLCQACEGKGTHTEHDMFKITQPRVNPMNFLPPHLGRYISRCMRNMAPGGAAPGASMGACGGGANKEKDKAAYDEYLSSVGANIAAFLDPFGIDVTYDVHHGNGNHQHGGWGRGDRCHAWEGMHRRAQKEGAPTDPKEAENDQKNAEAMETSHAENGETKKRDDTPMEDGHKAGSDHTGEEWTYVKEDGSEARPPSVSPIPMPGPSAIPMPGPASTDQPDAGATPPPRPSTGGTTQDNLYPNLRIQQSLDQMLSMGFTNTDGWLSTLLAEHDGDIGSTLDAIKAKATQQLENLRGSH